MSVRFVTVPHSNSSPAEPAPDTGAARRQRHHRGPVLVAYDGSASARAAIGEVAELLPGAQARGAELATRAGLRARGEALRAEGPVWRAILARAETLDAAVVVLGTRGSSPLHRSVSDHVAHHARRPVLLVAGRNDQQEETP